MGFFVKKLVIKFEILFFMLIGVLL